MKKLLIAIALTLVVSVTAHATSDHSHCDRVAKFTANAYNLKEQGYSQSQVRQLFVNNGIHVAVGSFPDVAITYAYDVLPAGHSMDAVYKYEYAKCIKLLNEN